MNSSFYRDRLSALLTDELREALRERMKSPVPQFYADGRLYSLRNQLSGSHTMILPELPPDAPIPCRYEKWERSLGTQWLVTICGIAPEVRILERFAHAEVDS